MGRGTRQGMRSRGKAREGRTALSVAAMAERTGVPKRERTLTMDRSCSEAGAEPIRNGHAKGKRNSGCRPVQPALKRLDCRSISGTA